MRGLAAPIDRRARWGCTVGFFEVVVALGMVNGSAKYSDQRRKIWLRTVPGAKMGNLSTSLEDLVTRTTNVYFPFQDLFTILHALNKEKSKHTRNFTSTGVACYSRGVIFTHSFWIGWLVLFVS